MGVFSWLTADTKESIPIQGASREPFPVVVVCPDDTHLIEKAYQGYGVFGGKDVYEALAEWHGRSTRDEGIDIYYDEDSLKYPIKIIRYEEGMKVPLYGNLPVSEDCPYQGLFYD